jgi:hypothetical protein
MDFVISWIELSKKNW